MLKILLKIKDTIVFAIIGIGLSIANIFAGRDFLEYIISIVGDMLSVVFNYDKEKSKKTTGDE